MLTEAHKLNFTVIDRDLISAKRRTRDPCWSKDTWMENRSLSPTSLRTLRSALLASRPIILTESIEWGVCVSEQYNLKRNHSFAGQWTTKSSSLEKMTYVVKITRTSSLLSSFPCIAFLIFAMTLITLDVKSHLSMYAWLHRYLVFNRRRTTFHVNWNDCQSLTTQDVE